MNNTITRKLDWFFNVYLENPHPLDKFLFEYGLLILVGIVSLFLIARWISNLLTEAQKDVFIDL